MPTGVALGDARQQLFDAAERVLFREGPNALTSRAVTTEAGVAKGVLHRHFADFDTFLAEFVIDRISHINAQADALNALSGTSTVIENLTGAMVSVFGSVAVPIVGLVLSRYELLARLRETMPAGLPLMKEVTMMIASYLSAERDLGRVAPATSISVLAPTLVGTLHLQFAGRTTPPPDSDAVRTIVTTLIGGIVIES